MNKFLKILLLGPLLPIIGVAGDNDNGDDNNNGGDAGDNKDNDNKDKNNDNKDNDNTRTFTQAELNSILEKRLSRERKNLESDYKKKLEREKLDEVERIKLEKEDLEKQMESIKNQAEEQIIKNKIILESAKLKIIDAEAAFLLIDKKEIEDIGVEEALKKLIKDKPYLINNSSNNFKVGDDQSGSNNSSAFSFNSLIRKAAGR